MNNNLKKIRKEKDLSLFQLSQLTSLSIGYLCHLENGSRVNPSYIAMKKICKALNKEISDIFDV